MISPRAILHRSRHFEVPRVAVPALLSMPRVWRRLSPGHLLWLALWAPWWIGNELPPPPPPRSREADMVEPPQGTPGAWILDTMDDLRFRFGLVWTVALALRGAWIGGVAGIGLLLLGLAGVVTPPEPRELAILAGAGAVLGLVLRLFHRPRYAQVALLLERAFDLRSRLSTAVAGLRFDATEGGGLHRIQLADAANALGRARTQLRPVHWVPVREIFIGLIVALALLLLLVAQRPEGGIGAAANAGVPPFVPVSERLAASREQAVPPEMPDPATLQQVEDISRTSNQAREDLETIAGALQSNTITAPAGDAITNEDYSGANRQLTESAEDVTQAPPEDRARLADELDEAADQVSEQNPELADSAHRAADDVRSGEDSGGLGDLGDEIERTGEDVIPQQSEGGELSDSPSGDEGAPQAGSTGGSDSSAQASEPQPGEQGAGETQASSEGDPGSGMSASAGTGESEDGGSTSQGDGGEGNQQATDGSGEQGQPSGASQSDGPGEGQESQQPGDSQAGGGGTRGDPNEEGDSSQGSGAGGGERDANDPTQEGGAGGDGGEQTSDEQAPESGQGEAGDPPPGGGDQDGEEQRGTAGGGSSIQLPGTSDERVRSGSTIGASSVGTGGGVGAASGDSSGSASGSTGPDPNTVPARWRSVVEDYFREGGAP